MGKAYTVKKNKMFKIHNMAFSIFWMAFVIGMLFLVGCSKNDAEIFDDNILKAVEIRISKEDKIIGYATGCFISKDGLILTNKHVVYDEENNMRYDRIEIRSAQDTEWQNATIQKVSDNYDLATIKAEKDECKYYELEENIKQGEE